MSKYSNLIVALLLTATTSLAVAQTTAGNGAIPDYTRPPLPQPVPVTPTPMPGPSNIPLGTCDASGCWGTDGVRYNHGGGNFMFGTNGKVCRYIAPGAPLTCN